jgi:ubiquinone/menaquinone biosynthesis C-methylase UbiE
MEEKEKYKEIYSGVVGQDYKQRHGEGYGRGFWGEGILEYFKSVNPKSVLDVGCGYGKFCNDVTDFTETVYGADIASVVTGNVVKNDKIKYLDCEAKSIPLPDNSVEWVTSFDCLEHCLPQDINNILNEFDRVSTKGFILSLSHVNDAHLGLVLHMTVQPEQWWLDKIKKYGEIKREGLIPVVNYKYIVCIK